MCVQDVGVSIGLQLHAIWVKKKSRDAARFWSWHRLKLELACKLPPLHHHLRFHQTPNSVFRTGSRPMRLKSLNASKRLPCSHGELRLARDGASDASLFGARPSVASRQFD